ncbi:hypothetical protein ACYSNM_05515 [Myroides sp. LJL116]
MKKYVFIIALFAGLSAMAQSKDYQENPVEIDELVEKSAYYGLSDQQREKLIQRKRSIGREYAAIGKDRSLSGYEKGVRKRELSIQIDKDIRLILGDTQYNNWRGKSKGYHKDYYEDRRDYYEDRKDRYKDRIEDEIDRLEDQYERDIDRIERKYKYDKSAMKREKEVRKAIYKRDKEALKRMKKRY